MLRHGGHQAVHWLVWVLRGLRIDFDSSLIDGIGRRHQSVVLEIWYFAHVRLHFVAVNLHASLFCICIDWTRGLLALDHKVVVHEVIDDQVAVVHVLFLWFDWLVVRQAGYCYHRMLIDLFCFTNFLRILLLTGWSLNLLGIPWCSRIVFPSF